MTRRPFTAEDIFNLKCSGDAHLSPDAKSVAYVTQHHDKDKEKSFTDIYLASTESGASRKLTNSGKDRSPRWSPDGRRVAFVSDRSGKGQIWLIDPNGGEAWRLPTKESVQGDPVWSPDGKKVFFTSNAFSKAEDWVPYAGAPDTDRQRALDQAKRALAPKGDAQGEKGKEGAKPNDVRVVTRLRYRMDGTGYFGDLRRQVFSIVVPDAMPGENDELATQVTSGDFDHSSPCVTPDSRYLVLPAVREDDADYRHESDLWLFDVATGKSHLLYDAPGPSSNPQVSPDGKYLAFFGHDRKRGHSTRSDLWVIPVESFLHSVSEGSEPAPLTVKDASNLTAHLDRQAGGMAGAEPRFGGFGSSPIWDGNTLYFSMEDHGEVFIYSAEAPAWSLTKVFGQPGRPISGYDFRNGVFAYQASTSVAPEDVFISSGGVERRLTSANDEFMATISTSGNAEKFTYLAKDGQGLDGWVIYPDGYEVGKKYPTVLLVHGGPHGAYSSAFMFTGQYFASHGYAVIYCNPRGSTSYGQEFMACIDGDWGNKDYWDVMSCVDAAVAKGFVDEANVFLHGWSYGGYWTVWAITQTDRFKAACAGACVSNMHSDYGTADIMWADEWEYGGKPWKAADLLLDRSAISHVPNVKTPVLLLHGENDMRCPISNTEQFYVGLRRLGKTAVMVRYPDEFHGLRRPLHRIDRFQRMLAWFDYYRQH